MKQKIVVVFFIVMSVGLTVFQVLKTEEDAVEVVGVLRDIPAGTIVTERDVGTMYVLDSPPSGSVRNTAEFLGKVSVVALKQGVVAMPEYFEEPSLDEMPAGYSQTAMKLSPDSAMCFTSELDSEVDVYFVGSKGEIERLGEVTIKEFYDHKMNQEDVLVYVVVVGKTSIVQKIVKNRSLGRLELVKSK